MLTAIEGSVTFDSTEITDCGKFTINETQETTSYGSSSTDGHRKRALGHKDWTATVEVKGDTSGLSLTAGDSGSLVCKDADSDGYTYTGNAILESIAYDVDIDGGTPIGVTLTFGGNGALSKT